MSGGFGGENGGFSESAASLTFHDPDDDNEVGIDTQADDFRFNFTLPSQDFQNYGASSLSFDDDRLEDNIKMVKFGFGKKLGKLSSLFTYLRCEIVVAQSI